MGLGGFIPTTDAAQPDSFAFYHNFLEFGRSFAVDKA
jgi:hypothetical protein